MPKISVGDGPSYEDVPAVPAEAAGPVVPAPEPEAEATAEEKPETPPKAPPKRPAPPGAK